ncbi:hypothetical protein [Marinicella meishanensis]|uniref:hypothetical protein n=1 Tax=Marinicella meishanensis TaxID=2873263 RepID=UPI001CBFACB7|nr:hypothetical protein [Marinicella sp. NBU2979]
MTSIQTVLQLNGLNCLLFGAMFVFLPDTVILFLSPTAPAPKIVILALGVVLNLYGMVLLWLSQQAEPKRSWIKLIAIGDFLWVLFTAALILSQQWITALDGITAAGLVAIIVGWFGWLQWQYARQP